MRIPLSRLLLDENNPRLPLGTSDLSQENLLRIFDKNFNLFPIARSMVDNGYFDEEPLFVVQGPADKFIVVEGNRRLATLKFLTDLGARRLSLSPEKWNELAREAKNRNRDFSEVPAIVYTKKKKLEAILAFRHISAVLRWDSLQKARFINNIVEGRKFSISFNKLSEDTGAARTTIQNLFVSYRAYLQAKERDFDVSKLENDYSLFYTALSYPVIKRYVGIDTKRKNPAELRNPIPSSKMENLGRIIEYVHGMRGIIPVIKESRDISKLAEIMSNEKCASILDRTRNLEIAYSFIRGTEHRLLENLQIASEYLSEALRDAHMHSGNPDVSRWLKQCLETFLQMLNSFPEIRKELRERIVTSA
jgi:hypothetical protein